MFYLRRERLGSSDVVSSARRRAVMRRGFRPFLANQEGFRVPLSHSGYPQDPRTALVALLQVFLSCRHRYCCLTAHCQNATNCHP